MKIGLITGTVDKEGKGPSLLKEPPKGYETIRVGTDFGEFPLSVATFGGKEVYFANRHYGEVRFGGRTEAVHLQPHQVDYRQVIQALYVVGVEGIVSTSATGRLSEAAWPGTFVAPVTFAAGELPRERSFSVPGLPPHAALEKPVNPTLLRIANDAWGEVKHTIRDFYEEHDPEKLLKARFINGLDHPHEHGLGIHYRTIHGPRFAQPPEEEAYRAATGATVIGMCADPEFQLAGEAGIPYLLLATVSDHSHYPGAPSVDHLQVILAAEKMAPAVMLFLEEIVSRIPGELHAQRGLGFASMTAPHQINLRAVRDQGLEHTLNMAKKQFPDLAKEQLGEE